MDLTELAARVQRLEDLESIKQLKARYCEICDDDHDPDRITSVFTPDGIWEGKGIATATGHAEIRSLFERFQSLMSFTQHMTMNPKIDVDGDTATGTWYFFGPFTMRKRNQARWQTTRYREDYERTEDGWKISHLRVEGGISADYETGWARAK